MLNKFLYRAAVPALLAAALLAPTAEAATVTNLGGVELVDVTKSTNIVGGAFTSAPDIKSANVIGVTRSPFENLVSYGTEYFNLGKGESATLVLDGVMSVLSFLWGSPDAYNSVTLMLGSSVVDVLSLDDIPAPVTAGLNAFFVEISGALFDSVVFDSDSNALEFSNITATSTAPLSNQVSAVPLPAGGLLLVGAFGGLAMLRRRKSV